MRKRSSDQVRGPLMRQKRGYGDCKYPTYMPIVDETSPSGTSPASSNYTVGSWGAKYIICIKDGSLKYY